VILDEEASSALENKDRCRREMIDGEEKPGR